MGFNDELQALVDEVANRVDRWTGHTAWTFEPVGCQKSAWPVSCSDDQVGCAA